MFRFVLSSSPLLFSVTSPVFDQTPCSRAEERRSEASIGLTSIPMQPASPNHPLAPPQEGLGKTIPGIPSFNSLTTTVEKRPRKTD